MKLLLALFDLAVLVVLVVFVLLALVTLYLVGLDLIDSSRPTLEHLAHLLGALLIGGVSLTSATAYTSARGH